MKIIKKSIHDALIKMEKPVERINVIFGDKTFPIDVAVKDGTMRAVDLVTKVHDYIVDVFPGVSNPDFKSIYCGGGKNFIYFANWENVNGGK